MAEVIFAQVSDRASHYSWSSNVQNLWSDPHSSCAKVIKYVEERCFIEKAVAEGQCMKPIIAVSNTETIEKAGSSLIVAEASLDISPSILMNIYVPKKRIPKTYGT